jgi:hypothetical protein
MNMPNTASMPEFAPRERAKPEKATSGLSERTLTFGDLIEGIKSGDVAAKVLESVPGNLEDSVKHLVEAEGCSTEFASRFFQDKKFQRRVVDVCQNFAKAGEHMGRMEEAEIFTQLMESSSDNIGKLLETTDLQKSFSNLEDLSPDEIKIERLRPLQSAIEGIKDPDQHRDAQQILADAFAEVQLKNNDWKTLYASPALLEQFVKIRTIQELYESATDGKTVSALHRRIELHWDVRPDGTKVPVMGVAQMAKNKETGVVSMFGFDIAKEPRFNRETGKLEQRRVAKEGVIIIDQEARGKNQGIKFLLDKLNLVKNAKLDDFEFRANINVGSYVWARITDMDVPANAKEFLSAEEQAAIGTEPWSEEQEKLAKAKLFETHIFPAFDQKMQTALGTLTPEVQDQYRQQLEAVLAQAQQLADRASEGDASMEELAELGKGLDIFSFTEDGEVVSADDPRAKHKGHLGKASLMGIPWQARISLDRKSLGRIIDKLNKGRPIMNALMKVGLLVLH